MIRNAKRAHALVGGVIGLNLLLATAAVAGVVPRPTATETVAAVHAPATVDEPGGAVQAGSDTATTAAPDTTVAPATTTPPTTAAPKATKSTPSTDAPQTTAAPSTTPPATSAAVTTPPVTLPPRANPSAAQVQAAIQQLHQRIPLFTATDAQARQFGDSVCSAFDQGQTYSQVQASVLKAVSSVPLISVSTSDADFAIRTAVQLFCPGYTSRLP